MSIGRRLLATLMAFLVWGTTAHAEERSAQQVAALLALSDEAGETTPLPSTSQSRARYYTTPKWRPLRPASGWHQNLNDPTLYFHRQVGYARLYYASDDSPGLVAYLLGQDERWDLDRTPAPYTDSETRAKIFPERVNSIYDVTRGQFLTPFTPPLLSQTVAPTELIYFPDRVLRDVAAGTLRKALEQVSAHYEVQIEVPNQTKVIEDLSDLLKRFRDLKVMGWMTIASVLELQEQFAQILGVAVHDILSRDPSATHLHLRYHGFSFKQDSASCQMLLEGPENDTTPAS